MKQESRKPNLEERWHDMLDEVKKQKEIEEEEKSREYWEGENDPRQDIDYVEPTSYCEALGRCSCEEDGKLSWR